MKKTIARNLAILSAIFIVTMSIMLTINYFQTITTTPLQTTVVETLKVLNDQNSDNPELRDQIRQLDLLARKAYFVRVDHLMAGVYILIGMLVVMIVSLRVYYAGTRDIPPAELPPADEWAVKSGARRYIILGASGLAAVAVVFSILSLPSLRSDSASRSSSEEASATVDASFDASSDARASVDANAPAAEFGDTAAEDITGTADSVGTADAAETETTATEEVPVSRVTHNGFRGNNSAGTSAARGLPSSWNLAAGTNIAWRQSVPRQGYNSPVINGDRVFFSGADSEARELYCHRLSTGERLWAVSASNIPGSPSSVPDTSADTGLAASTVTTNGRTVCAIFATGDIIAADMEGNLLWAKNLGVPDNHYGYASSPVMYGNLVIVQWDNSADAKVVALDSATGNVVWSRARADRIAWSSPMIASVGGSPTLIVMGTPAITAYNPSNGEQLWRVECLSGEVGASPCYSGGVIYGASEYAKLVAVNAADGSLLWESTDYLPEVSSPVVAGGNLVVATSYGMVVAYDAKTGEIKKEHELGEEFYSSPVVADGRVWLVSNSGKMFIFSTDEELTLLGSFETGERSFATPAFTDGRIVIRTEESIYCVSEG
jgi:outer membrane protein assembly factor BamB